MDFDDYLFEKYNLKYMNDVITIFQARDAAKEYYSELSRLRSEGSHADVKRLVESAIRDTFNQVYYSHLHPEDYPAMTDVQWEDKWMAENFDKWRPLPEAPRDNNPITPNP